MLDLIHRNMLAPHLPTLALLAAEQPEVFADYLTDGSVGGWLDVPADEQKLDLLLLFAMDQKLNNRLFPGHLTPAALGAWLLRVGDERGEEIASYIVAGNRHGSWMIGHHTTDPTEPDSESWLSPPEWGLRERWQFDSETAAWLDLKRRVLGMFPELNREVVDVAETTNTASGPGRREFVPGIPRLVRPVEFLPARLPSPPQ